ncbi:MAG: hypothetical protein CVU64_00970 [Deltaproteobacteria bacterium HGW-Deltaproteobacteria-21]|jgi:hypothetical protein|nr:MAG: hypothetical protein CVU64_00970 [Deltaproteobacteria bacterium HGW-Deltaproteobacteria-21]
MEADISHIPFALDVVDAAPSGMVPDSAINCQHQDSAVSKISGKLHAGAESRRRSIRRFSVSEMASPAKGVLLYP